MFPGGGENQGAEPLALPRNLTLSTRASLCSPRQLLGVVHSNPNSSPKGVGLAASSSPTPIPVFGRKGSGNALALPAPPPSCCQVVLLGCSVGGAGGFWVPRG